jgi:2-phosphosulfolactate phosphatase
MRLVLPSPNGSAISVEATRQHRRVLAGCLRNAAAVARSAQHIGQRIGLVAAGEHWPSVEQPDRAFRVALEDLLGAGAIVRSLAAARSPEAEVAVAAFERAAGDLAGYLRGCTSGRELIGLGFQQDVEMAAELDVSQTVPRFVDGAYVAETS